MFDNARGPAIPFRRCRRSGADDGYAGRARAPWPRAGWSRASGRRWPLGSRSRFRGRSLSPCRREGDFKRPHCAWPGRQPLLEIVLLMPVVGRARSPRRRAKRIRARNRGPWGPLRQSAGPRRRPGCRSCLRTGSREGRRPRRARTMAWRVTEEARARLDEFEIGVAMRRRHELVTSAGDAEEWVLENGGPMRAVRSRGGSRGRKFKGE